MDRTQKADFVQSFIKIRDTRIREEVDEEFREGLPCRPRYV